MHRSLTDEDVYAVDVEREYHEYTFTTYGADAKTADDLRAEVDSWLRREVPDPTLRITFWSPPPDAVYATAWIVRDGIEIAVAHVAVRPAAQVRSRALNEAMLSTYFKSGQLVGRTAQSLLDEEVNRW